jgi:hypothetical protein
VKIAKTKPMAGVEFIDENGGGAGVRLCKGQRTKGRSGFTNSARSTATAFLIYIGRNGPRTALSMMPGRATL